MHIYYTYVRALDELRSKERTGQARFAYHRPVKSHTPKPVTVSTVVPHPRPDVFAFLDVISNHETFTNHMLFDWSYSGPPAGLGAKAHVHSKAGMRIETIDIEVVESHAPVRSVERNVSAGGRRVGTGTYKLLERPHGSTEISFTYMWLRAPLLDRAFAPMVRRILRRGNERALDRLAGQLTRTAPASEATRVIRDASLGERTGLAAIEQNMLRHLLAPDRGSLP
jgi:hypothetical protein